MTDREILNKHLNELALTVAHVLMGENQLDCMMALLMAIEALAEEIEEDPRLPNDTKDFFATIGKNARYERLIIFDAGYEGMEKIRKVQ